MLLTVTVPDGLYPGDVMMVAAPNGQEFELSVPVGCFAGSAIEVDLPVEEEAAPPDPAMTQVTLTVPDGLYAGMDMSVDWGGVSYTIAVPEGVGPGHEISIELPALPDGGAPPGPAPPDPEADALLAHMMAEMDTADADDTQPLRVESPKPPPKAAPAPAPAVEADYSAYRFKPGQRVHVLRSTGAYALATVEFAYEMLFDTLYQVRTDDGLIKAAVNEEEMVEAPEAPPDPWAGFTDFMAGEVEY